jgi:Ca2+-binding RTX toxin-like protein
MTGGKGADTFFFVATGDSGKTKATSDTIFDFRTREGDLIELSEIDANTVLADDQDFKFIGTKGFHDKAGELRVVTDKSDTWIQGDVDGDGKADFMIHLDDKMALKADHFDL